MRPSNSSIVVVLLIATPTIAQDKPTATAPAARPAPRNERITCRSESHTGSHIAQSVCRSAAEWRELDQANTMVARRFVDMVVQRSSVLATALESAQQDQLKSDPDAAWRD